MYLLNTARRLNNINPNHFNSVFKYSNSASSVLYQYDKDPGPQFNNPDVQKLLKSLTRVRMEKIFRKRAVSNNHISYKFMTTEQIENEIKEITNRAQKFLQMPPVVKVIEDKHQIISQDPALKNFSDSQFVITDISFGLKDSERKIVIRNVDGTLEKACQSVRKRVNQIYFPLVGRKMKTPKLFEDEYLTASLKERNYVFILDRLCIQFEPYEKEYHDISARVFVHINESKCFDDLRSTRHFGPMVFFYAWHKIIDDLLIDMISRSYLTNSVELICLLYNIHGRPFDKSILQKFPSIDNEIKSQYKPFKSQQEGIIEETIGKTLEDFHTDDLCLAFIDKYVKEESPKRAQLELTIQTFRERNDEKRKLLEGLNKAHGVN